MLSDVELYTRLAALETRLSSMEQIMIRLYNTIMELLSHIRQHPHRAIAWIRIQAFCWYPRLFLTLFYLFPWIFWILQLSLFFAWVALVHVVLSFVFYFLALKAVSVLGTCVYVLWLEQLSCKPFLLMVYIFFVHRPLLHRLDENPWLRRPPLCFVTLPKKRDRRLV